jgi:hypothetical protein
MSMQVVGVTGEFAGGVKASATENTESAEFFTFPSVPKIGFVHHHARPDVNVAASFTKSAQPD